MPVGIMTLPTSKASELEALHDDPQGFYDYVNGVTTRAGAKLIDLFFDVAAERAYAIVEDLDDYRDVKAVSRILGAEGFIKMVRKELAIEAIEREARYSS
jgi:hypothetical protein